MRHNVIEALSRLKSDYDGIILGAGHNSLVLQAYLCLAGLNVLCLEHNDIAGGRTYRAMPAGIRFLHNPHSFYHRALNTQPWYRDLELERHGARYIEPDLNVAMLLPDGGEVLQWWTNFERTYASFAQVSPRDADVLRHWRQAFLPVVRDILGPEAMAPPLPAAERSRQLQQAPAGRLLLETSALSSREFVLREFEHPAVQAGLLFFNGLREVDLRAPGFGHHIPALLAAEGKPQMCVGGSGQLLGC